MYILLAVFIFSFLILVHELGHFFAAKLTGVRVNEFSICMGPALVQRRVGETTYSLRCIPIGGYCSMEDESAERDDPRDYGKASYEKRFFILIAGSAVNFLAGLLILIMLYSTAAGFSSAIISGFYDGCPLQSEQGLRVGDELYKIDGERVYVFSDVSMLLARNKTGVYDLTLRRDKELVALPNFTMELRDYERDGQIERRYGLLFTTEEKTLGGVLKNAWYTAINFARLVRLGLQDLISGIVGIQEMSGPVGIVSSIAEVGASAETAGDGLLNVVYIAAFLAVNLAVMNMLPIPALDGGRVFFLIVTLFAERLTGKKINPKYEGYIHAAGMAILLLFFAFITVKDILKLF